MNIQAGEKFTTAHHALLFSYIVKNGIELLGEGCTKTMENGVIAYATGRGQRMAKRAVIDGRKLNTLTYLTYGEWSMAGENMDIRMDLTAQEATMKAYACPWYNIWNEEGHLDYGKYYCMHIDGTLAKGFGGSVKLELESNRTCGADVCDFYFRGDSYTPEQLTDYAEDKKKIGTSAMKGWEYHTAHLYSVMAGLLVKTYGEPGQAVIDKALEDLDQKFGDGTSNALKQYAQADFQSVDDYQSVLAN